MSEEFKQIGVLSSPAELASLLLHMSGHTKPVCAVDGLLYDGQALCGKASVGGNPKRCNSDQPCRHKADWSLHKMAGK